LHIVKSYTWSMFKAPLRTVPASTCFIAMFMQEQVCSRNWSTLSFHSTKWMCSWYAICEAEKMFPLYLRDSN
jgi:hypothetical protein